MMAYPTVDLFTSTARKANRQRRKTTQVKNTEEPHTKEELPATWSRAARKKEKKHQRNRAERKEKATRKTDGTNQKNQTNNLNELDYWRLESTLKKNHLRS